MRKQSQKFRSLCAAALLVLCAAGTQAEDIKVEKVRMAGPFVIPQPVLIDSVTLNNTAFSTAQRLDTPISFDVVKGNPAVDIASVANPEKGSLNAIGFTFSTSTYADVEVKIEGAPDNKVYISGNEGAKKSLSPGQYDVLVKYVADTTAIKVTLHCDKDGAMTVVNDRQKRPFTLDDNMEMKYCRYISLSPTGKYLLAQYSRFDHNGKTIYETKITEVATGKVVRHNAQGVKWMPTTDRYYKVEDVDGVKNLVVTDPASGTETTIARNLPDNQVTVAPSEDYLVYNIYTEGPKKQDGVYAVVHPNDRQPGYRDRYTLGIYDMKTGISRPLTYGYHSTYLHDISHDGRYLIFSVSLNNIGKRPSEVSTFYRLDVRNMTTEKIIDADGFCNMAVFAPHSDDRVIVKGNAEAFGGIGKNLPEGMTPSMYEYQLFSLDIPTKKVTPLTKDFDPSVQDITASDYDGQIYFTAENKDSVSLYRLDPKTNVITFVDQPVEVVSSVTVADKAPLMMISGASECIPDRIYSIALGKKNRVTLVEDINKERMAEIQLGECKSFVCHSSRGYDITGFYLLPANFDPSRKYPVIVDYYGGCAPTSRRFGGGSHYPCHYWNAQGYIVFVVNPSGASGFGQEWAARHVNTAGEGVAEDIIEATEQFADSNPWVNKDKIGCVSASYGGFMTQVLLSKTDLFACGISHAGISGHTSYWGEGYWGFSYSETSMANSYPWTRKDLYVDRSPIYNADKIHKPILFTHGTADTNVPIGESIQMYTAMKILGVPTAFVMVEGENHGIMDYSKRKKWIDTMMAWFKRWLQDDDAWWNAMYPEVKQ